MKKFRDILEIVLFAITVIALLLVLILNYPLFYYAGFTGILTATMMYFLAQIRLSRNERNLMIDMFLGL